MTKVRNVQKNQILQEDIALGVGEVTQTRRGQQVTGSRLAVPLNVKDLDALSLLDPTVANLALVPETENNFVIYMYKDSDNSGVPAIPPYPGSWVPQNASSDTIIAETPPAFPAEGNRWINCTTWKSYSWTGAEWVEDNPSVGATGDLSKNTAIATGTTALRTLGDRFAEVVNVRNFGAIGDGVTDDSVAIQTALQAARLTGKALTFIKGDEYFLGTFPDDTDTVKFALDTDGMRVETNGCKFTAIASTAPYHDGRNSQVLFKVTSSDVVIGDFTVEADKIAKAGSDRQGMQAIWVENSTSNTRSLEIGTVVGTRQISILTVTSISPNNFRHRGITFTKLFNEDGYYVLNCAENGDEVAGIISSNSGVRAYFVYGIDNHDVNITSYNHQKFSDVVVARLLRDTGNIKLKYTCASTVTSACAVSIQYQTDAMDASITNVDIQLDITVSNPVNPAISLQT